jgi:hypothetical protein
MGKRSNLSLEQCWKKMRNFSSFSNAASMKGAVLERMRNFLSFSNAASMKGVYAKHRTLT